MGLDVFLRLGFHHLTAAGAWDHQLFLATVALAYLPHRWRRWLALATAFAVGHTSAIVALAARLVPLGQPWVEPAIAATIVAFALVEAVAVWRNPFAIGERRAWVAVRYALVLAFGFVHGLGFGAAVVPLLGTQTAAGTVAAQLAAFTVGVELAQVLILLGYWVVSYVVLELVNLYPTRLRLGGLIVVAALGLRALFGYF